MKLGIIGLGLIGSSLALKLKKEGVSSRIYGFDRNAEHIDTALDLRIIDEEMDCESMARKCDVVILSIPVDSSKELITSLLNGASEDCLIIDMGSTKAGICKAVNSHIKRKNFVAAHPIAGTEFTGPRAGFPELFEGKPMIICEKELSGDQQLNMAENLIKTLGMSLLFMDPDEHDLHAAYVSHLSHISSFTLAMTVLDIEKDEKSIFNLAGSGFDSTVRLAKSSAAMWSPIFIQNSKSLVKALEEYIRNLSEFKNAIENHDFTKLQQMMLRANEVKRILKS